MIAGYETTSTALAYATYILATKPDIQEKLVEEIDRYNWKEMSREETYDSATTLSYLDMFVREVLRMYPITPKAMSRECNTTTVVCGHTIEKGSLKRFSTKEELWRLSPLQVASFNPMCSASITTQISGDRRIRTSSLPNDTQSNVIRRLGCRSVSGPDIAWAFVSL